MSFSTEYWLKLTMTLQKYRVLMDIVSCRPDQVILDQIPLRNVDASIEKHVAK